MTIRAVLFDLDGTLVDSLEDLTDAVNHTRETFSLLPLTCHAVRQMIGKGARNLIRQALPDSSENDVERGLRLFIDFNTEHISDKSRLYHGAAETLKYLRAIDIRLAVVSNKNERLSSLILQKLGIHHFFGIICGGDTFSEMKPSPLPLLRIIDQMGVAPHEAVMVGDSINDIEAGRQAGIVTIGCRWGFGGPDELDGSDFLAYSCKDIFSIIQNLGVKTA
ncbi:MAG: HAD-IA family hydrolase [Deltaproteobacteria bacterium]